MKKSLIIFLQTVVVLIGIGALFLLLLEPQLEGRNAQATLFEIYFQDPFLILVYAGAIPFFMALYQAFKVLKYIGQDRVFSEAAVKALKTIKYCALIIIGFVIIEEAFIIFNNNGDDKAGGVFMGVLITFGSIVIAALAALFERILRNALELKSKNDLTV